MRFEWDPDKARLNKSKHGIDFDDALYVFEDAHAIFVPDRVDGETGEMRWHVIGMSGTLAVILVVHTVRGTPPDEAIRLISARQASRKELKDYEPYGI